MAIVLGNISRLTIDLLGLFGAPACTGNSYLAHCNFDAFRDCRGLKEASHHEVLVNVLSVMFDETFVAATLFLRYPSDHRRLQTFPETSENVDLTVTV